MDLSIILNPPSQSQYSVDLDRERSGSSQLHSPSTDPARATRRRTSSEIHREQHNVNGCLEQPSAVLNVPSNNRISCPSSTSAPSFAPHRSNYYDQIQDQTSFTSVPRQRSITDPSTSSRSLTNSTQYSQPIVPSHLLSQIHLHSNAMALPHYSSLETLASVATADAAVGQSSPQDLQMSDTFTELPLGSTRSRGNQRRPRSYLLQTEQHLRAAPEDSEYATNTDSRRSSSVSGTARVEARVTDPTSTTPAGPSCSYTAGCSTGSPLRKVVSHIFGRNKLCTKQIPKGIWVCYCRKHYQRSRYRNPSGFALLQCDLVRKQIDRLDQWGGVSNWIIKIRKREELRLNRENAERAAGRIAEYAASDGDEDMDVVRDIEQSTSSSEDQSLSTSVEAHLSNKRRFSTATAPLTSSRWLIKFTGSGKTTQEVLEVLDIIETEVRETKCNFPDIEILPNVSPPSHGSDHQRSLSSWSSSSGSSAAYPNEHVDHHETQGPNRRISSDNESSPPETPPRRRTLQRGTRSRL